MAQLSNRSILSLLLILSISFAMAQSTNRADNSLDYKDRESHENFRKRRKAVAAWQINQLKKGALIVRLKTNQMAIDALLKSGDEVGAEKLRIEQAGINTSMIKAFKDHYRFSKLYFMYSGASDSLLKGVKAGIFIDSTLNVNPSIRITEEFYLIAESDFVYSSSIGFVPESAAPKVTEHGTPSSFEYPIVFKNKYGHQLKEPFPVNTEKFVMVEKEPTVVLTLNGVPVTYNVFTINKPTNPAEPKETERHKYIYKGQEIVPTIPRDRTYRVLAEHVIAINSELQRFYHNSMGFSEHSKNYHESKPFFY
jgi:hypothetical protein